MYVCGRSSKHVPIGVKNGKVNTEKYEFYLFIFKKQFTFRCVGRVRLGNVREKHLRNTACENDSVHSTEFVRLVVGVPTPPRKKETSRNVIAYHIFRTTDGQIALLSTNI